MSNLAQYISTCKEYVRDIRVWEMRLVFSEWWQKKQDIWSTFTRHLLGFLVFKGHFRAFPTVTMWFYSGKEQREHNAKHLLVFSSWETKSQVWNDINYDRVFIFGWSNNWNVLNQVGMYRDGSHDRSHEDTWPDWIMTLILIAVTNTQERWCTSMHKWVYGTLGGRNFSMQSACFWIKKHVFNSACSYVRSCGLVHVRSENRLNMPMCAFCRRLRRRVSASINKWVCVLQAVFPLWCPHENTSLSHIRVLHMEKSIEWW